MNSQGLSGAASVAAASLVLAGSFHTWIQGASSCGESDVFFYSHDLWQVGSITLWLVMGGAVILALVGINALGLPILRWIDPIGWIPPLIATVLIAVGSLGTGLPSPLGPECVSSSAFGPGKWICVVAAVLGAVVTALTLPVGLDSGRGTD
jgi:hypothetical protein